MTDATMTLSADERVAIKAAYKALTKAVNLHEKCKRCKVETGDTGDVLMYLVERYEALAKEYGISLEE